ncbi:hypothetical protein SAY86_012145 [Trapa natans]|uniref:NAC domain-containing protein n=1 Tax=Trapa natans TaxID=22666 RepID=A0AAN7MCB3_TRANT|nr:hypothetical protein SAY86_012145 [Trapa natans]
MGDMATDPLAQISLPPGFRFYPTDEELLVQYLCRKVAGHYFNLPIIGDIDLYKFDPWDLPSKALFGEKEWYFFSPRDRKYPNGSRPNRVAGSGYWKATGTDKVIITEGRRVGIKKALVFYAGKAPKGTKTNWIMHEYRLLHTSCKSGSPKLDEWVLCRIYKKNSGSERAMTMMSANRNVPCKEQSHEVEKPSSSSSSLDDMLESLPEIENRFFYLPQVDSLKTVPYQLHQQQQSYVEKPNNLLSLGSGSFDWTVLAGLTSAPPELTHAGHPQQPIFTYANNSAYVPAVCNVEAAMQQMVGASMTEVELQNGLRRSYQQIGAFHHQNPSLVAQSLAIPNDPFGYRYPTR